MTAASSIGTNPLRGCAAIYNDLFGRYLHATNACKHFSGTLDNFHDAGSKKKRGLGFLPATTWTAQRGAGWSEGLACSACDLDPVQEITYQVLYTMV